MLPLDIIEATMPSAEIEVENNGALLNNGNGTADKDRAPKTNVETLPRPVGKQVSEMFQFFSKNIFLFLSLCWNDVKSWGYLHISQNMGSSFLFLCHYLSHFHLVFALPLFNLPLHNPLFVYSVLLLFYISSLSNPLEP